MMYISVVHCKCTSHNPPVANWGKRVADENDWATKFGPQTQNWKLAVASQLSGNEAKKALVAFYALQKQRGYNPFRVINTFKITLDKVSLNAIAD